MISRVIKFFAAVAVIGWCAGATTGAQADTTSYLINTPNAALSGFTGPYASVGVNLTDTTHATITFTGLVNGGFQYLLGGAQAADVNVNATSWSITSLSATRLAGFSAGALSNGGASNVSSFGAFNQTVDVFDGFTNSALTISFILTNLTGTWASATSVLIANALGNTVAAHIFACPTPCSSTLPNIVTGFASNGSGVVPIPGALPLFATGLGGLGMLLWRKRRKVTAGAA